VGKSIKTDEDAKLDGISELSERMALFIAEYQKDFNASRAAKAAGYKWPDKMGSRLLKVPAIKAALGASVAQKLEKIDISVERTLNEVGRIAFFDPACLFENDGSLKRLADIDPDSRAAIAGVEVTEIFDGAAGEQKHVIGLLKKVKLSDRLSALDKLMRYHALYKDRVEHTGKDGEPLQMVVKHIAWDGETEV
jgi:phage terminase small subunit